MNVQVYVCVREREREREEERGRKREGGGKSSRSHACMRVVIATYHPCLQERWGAGVEYHFQEIS